MGGSRGRWPPGRRDVGMATPYSLGEGPLGVGVLLDEAPVGLGLFRAMGMTSGVVMRIASLRQ
jgi:hypothetical protein